MKHFFFISFLMMLLMGNPVALQAQMFSVDDEPARRTNTSFSSYVRVGLEPVDFEYQGMMSSLIGVSDLSFSGTAANISYEGGAFNLSISLGNDITGMEDYNYFSFGLKFLNPFYLIRSPNFIAGVPVQLSSTVTTVRNDLLSDEFSQTNLSIGAGALANFIIPNKMNLSLNFIPNIGFSTASGGFIGGKAFSLTGKARLNFYNLLFGRNLSLGYDYLFDSYDIDGEELDYDLTGHRLTLGISF